jgi:hypothetical protein
MSVRRGTSLGFALLAMRGGQHGVPDMQSVAHFEPVAWWWARNQIGRALSERYKVPKELPPELQTLVLRVDAIEGNQLLSYSGTRSDREQMIDARRVGGIKAFPDWFVLT